jgi:hypothetical protein
MAEAAHRDPPATGVDFAALPRVAERSDITPLSLAGSGVLQGDQPLLLRGLIRDWPETGLAAGDLLDTIAASVSERPLPFYTAPADAGGASSTTRPCRVSISSVARAGWRIAATGSGKTRIGQMPGCST